MKNNDRWEKLMKKKQIIQKEAEFTEIIHKCPYKKNNYFIIYYRLNSAQNRFGISVPTKTGKANVRNKIKRRVKNILDQNKNYVQTSFDYVIIIRKRILELDYRETEQQLITLITKIGEKNAKK